MTAVLPNIPDSWAWSDAATLCAKIQDGTHFSPKIQLTSGRFRYLTAKNVRASGLDLDDVTYLREEDHREIVRRCDPRRGDVLLVKDGVNTGDAAMYTLDEESSLLSSVCLLRPRSDALLGSFLRYFLLSPAGYRLLSGRMGGSAIRRIIVRHIKEIPVPLAPLAEQSRIVAEIEKHLSRIDVAVVALKRAQENLKRYRAAVLSAACSGRLVPTEAELAREACSTFEPATVLAVRIAAARGTKSVAPDLRGASSLPEGWCWASIDAVGDVLLGRQRAPQYLTGRYPHPYLRVANVKDNRIDLADVEVMDFDPAHANKYALRPGDILASEGQSLELVGQSAIYRGGIDGLCFQKTLHRFRPVPSGPSSEFAQLVFRTWVRTGVFTRFASITTNIAHLTLERFKACPFPLPPAKEQIRIVAEVDRRLSVVDVMQSEIQTSLIRADRLRQSVLKRAFEGKLVAQDPSDEPASLLLQRIRASVSVCSPGTFRRTAHRHVSPNRRQVPDG